MSKRTQKRNCGVTELQATLGVCRLPVEGDIRIWLDPANLPSDFETTSRTILAGASLWSPIIGRLFKLCSMQADSHITIEFRRIDTAGGILAWSELPCPYQPPISQRYDTADQWGMGYPPATGRVSLAVTAAHEIGHALGIGHGPRGNIMFRSIEDVIIKLGEWDIAQARARYSSNPDLPEGDTMNKLLQCVLTVLPTFLTCVLGAQAEAEQNGERGPIEALDDLIAQALRKKND